MNATQVKALRAEINAAHAANNPARAAVLQRKLHAHFISESRAFFDSAEGKAWAQRGTV